MGKLMGSQVSAGATASDRVVGALNKARLSSLQFQPGISGSSLEAHASDGRYLRTELDISLVKLLVPLALVLSSFVFDRAANNPKLAKTGI
jgi:hypothetical protein